MFRELRRKKQRLTENQMTDILKTAPYGTLAVMGDEGYPYAVPLNFLYENGAIYIHCAKSGHKTDAIKQNDKVTFSVVGRADVIKEKYTTFYQSVTVFGRAEIMENEKEIQKAITAFAIKYYPDDTEENRKKAIDDEYAALCMIKIHIEHMSGKQTRDLVNPDVYVDLKANGGAGAVGFFTSKGKVIFCGSEVYAMDKSEKSAEYEMFAKENDIHFLFDDFIPEIPFYTVPYTSVAALTSDGGFIASVGKPFDLYDKMEIVYITKDRKCFLITEDSTKFLSAAPHWREHLTPYDKIEFFDSKADAEKAYLIEDMPKFQNEM